MSRIIDPKEFGMPPRTVLEQTGSDTIFIVIKRKSRIIMADGKKLVEKARKIQKVRPEVNVMLKTSAPVCSKTLLFFAEEGIGVIPVEE